MESDLKNNFKLVDIGRLEISDYDDYTLNLIILRKIG